MREYKPEIFAKHPNLGAVHFIPDRPGNANRMFRIKSLVSAFISTCSNIPIIRRMKPLVDKNFSANYLRYQQ